MQTIKQLSNRIIGYIIIFFLVFFLFRIPSFSLIIACVIFVSLYILTSPYFKQAYILICFCIPLVLGLVVPLKQLNEYPSVAVFYAALIWTALFTILLLFFNQKEINKDNRPDNNKKNQ